MEQFVPLVALSKSFR